MNNKGVPFADQRVSMTHADFIREIARAAVEARDYTAKALGEQPQSAADRYKKIIREQFGTAQTHKAAPVPDSVSKIARKNNIPPERLLAALCDIANGGKQ